LNGEVLTQSFGGKNGEGGVIQKGKIEVYLNVTGGKWVERKKWTRPPCRQPCVEKEKEKKGRRNTRETTTAWWAGTPALGGAEYGKWKRRERKVSRDPAKGWVVTGVKTPIVGEHLKKGRSWQGGRGLKGEGRPA